MVLHRPAEIHKAFPEIDVIWRRAYVEHILYLSAFIVPSKTCTSTSASFIAPKEKLQCFTTIGKKELNKLITASKPTTFLLDPVPTKLLRELSPVAEEPLLNTMNSSLSLGHVPKPFKLVVIKPLFKKPQIDPSELANYRPISNFLFKSKILEKVVSAQLCSLLQFLFISVKNFSQVSGPTINVSSKLHAKKYVPCTRKN